MRHTHSTLLCRSIQQHKLDLGGIGHVAIVRPTHTRSKIFIKKMANPNRIQDPITHQQTNNQTTPETGVSHSLTIFFNQHSFVMWWSFFTKKHINIAHTTQTQIASDFQKHFGRIQIYRSRAQVTGHLQVNEVSNTEHNRWLSLTIKFLVKFLRNVKQINNK